MILIEMSENSVFVYKLDSEGTLESKVLDLQRGFD